MPSSPKRKGPPTPRNVYLVQQNGHHWTLCREDDPEYALGSFDNEERALQAARYLARLNNDGRVRVVRGDGHWETKFRQES